MIPYNLIIILSYISFIFCDNKVTTYCGNLNVTAFTRSKIAYTKIIQKWNTTISNRGYYTTNGCLRVNQRNVIGLYNFTNKTQAMMSLCVSSAANCPAAFTGDIKTFFNELMGFINTSEKLKSVTGIDINLLGTTIEWDFAPPANGVTFKEIKHTQNALTYSLSTSYDYPVKCFKKLTTTQPTLKPSDLYYILKPRTNNQIFTEYFESSDYDCNFYTLYLKCVPLPHQDSVVNSVLITTLYSNKQHKGSGACPSYVDAVSEPEPAPKEEEDEELPTQEIPQLRTSNPIEDFSSSIESFSSLDLNAKLDKVREINRTLDNSLPDSIVKKLSVLTENNMIISKMNCSKYSNDTLKECNEGITLIQKKSWDVIESVLNKSSSLMDSLESTGENFESNIKAILISMISTFKNWNSFDKETYQKALNLSSLLIDLSPDIITATNSSTFIENKAKVKNDIYNLLSATMSGALQITQLDFDDEPFLYSKELSQIRKAMTSMIKTLSNGGIISKSTLNFNYQLLSINTKLAKDELQLKDTYLSFPQQGMIVKFPITYLNQTYYNDSILGIASVIYEKYPFLTEQGNINYYHNVLSLDLLSTKGEIIHVKDLEKNNRVKVYYRKYYLNSTDDTCYGFNYTKNKSPSTSDVETDTSDSHYMRRVLKIF